MSLEDKINLLKDKCSQYETKEFLTFLAGILLQTRLRSESPFLKKLMSPMRQLFYLGYLNTCSKIQGKKKRFDEVEWDEMATLLHEIEIEYFYMLGFPKGGNETKEDVKKISVTMPTFMNYFFNGPLSYQEQDIERIENIFSDFADEIDSHYGLAIPDFIYFYDLINEEINKNLGKVTKYMNPEVWQEFTQSCIDKGLDDPIDWIDESPEEIYAYVNFLQNPGSFLKVDLNKVDYTNITKNKFKKILGLFTLQSAPKDRTVYYTDKNSLMTKPFIKISNTEYLPFFAKQYLNACYDFLFDYCSSIDRNRLLKRRDKFVENKVFSLFECFFKKKGFVYMNYSIDDNVSEQDILVLFKNIALIIEVKAGTYRAPLRDPNKAYKKLKSDFKNIIQNAYNQTLRVKNAFYENDSLTIKNDKKQKLYEFKTDKYKDNLYSIVIPFERFGHIQSNLEELLDIDDEDNYPWAISLDDFEAFLLTLSKKRNKIQSLLEYIKYRENYHGHLLCGDELELCGSFLKNPNQYKELSLKEETILTTEDLTEPIEKTYSNGMGFKNERNIKNKRDRSVEILYDKK